MVVKVCLIQNLKTILYFFFKSPWEFPLSCTIVSFPFHCERKGEQTTHYLSRLSLLCLGFTAFSAPVMKMEHNSHMSPQSNELFHPSEQRNRKQCYRKKEVKKLFLGKQVSAAESAPPFNQPSTVCLGSCWNISFGNHCLCLRLNNARHWHLVMKN